MKPCNHSSRNSRHSYLFIYSSRRAPFHTEHDPDVVGCNDCHSPHQERTNPFLLVRDGYGLCLKCHKEVESEFRKPFHHKVLEGGITCRECHSGHGERNTAEARRSSEGINSLCASCHADKHGPFVFEHLALKRSEDGCVTCHSPHGSVNNRMLVRSNVFQLCIQCHRVIGLSKDPALGVFPHDLGNPRFRNCTTCHTSGNRTRAAGSCFAISQDHHHAIVLLIEHRLYASAFSLLRSAFEAYVRGQWLAHCATDGQIEKYLKDWSPPKIDDLLAAVEKTPGFSEQVLSRVKAKGWDTMCAYTHTGGLHIQRWNTSDGIEPNYSPEEVLDVLAFTEFVGVMSVLGMAELANDEDLALRLLNKIKERAGK